VEIELRQIYLPGFKAHVTEANVNTLMGSYNLFRGQYATQNSYLINQILKTEWNPIFKCCGKENKSWHRKQKQFEHQNKLNNTHE